MLQHCNQFISLQATSTSVKLKIEYEVKNILEKRMISEKVYYLIKWKEYDVSKSTWKLKDNLLNCTRMLQQFEKKMWTWDHLRNLKKRN